MQFRNEPDKRTDPLERTSWTECGTEIQNLEKIYPILKPKAFRRPLPRRGYLSFGTLWRYYVGCPTTALQVSRKWTFGLVLIWI